MERYLQEIFLQQDIKKSEQPGIIPEIIVHDVIEKTEGPIAEVVVQEALDKTGFGKFNIKITFIGFLIHMNMTINLLSMGYILPSAICDFEMTTGKKGLLAIAPIVGTCFGALCWEFVTKSKGSRSSLIFALFLHSNAEICLSLLVSNYWLFLLVKVISGFAAMGAIKAIFMFVGDFQPKSHQKVIFACLSFVLAFSWIVLPLLAWAIIPLNFEFRNNYFFFGSWKLFMFIIAVPAEIFGIVIMFMPETPQYLARSGRNNELLIVLTKVYQENFKGPSDDYIKLLLKCGNVALVDLVNRCQNYSTFMTTSGKEEFKVFVNHIKEQGEDTIKAPYLKRLIVLSMAMFCVSSATYSLVTWFPEIIHRHSQYELLFPNQTSNGCTISKHLHTHISENGNFLASQCKQTVDPTVYRTSFFMGLSAIFPNLLYLMFVDKYGFQFIVAIYFSVGLIATLWLFFANSFIENIILACIFKSVLCTTLSILFEFNVELFPENIRIFTSSIATFCSRIGIVFGNGLFAYLIDDYCSTLIIIVALQLSLAIGLSVTLRA